MWWQFLYISKTDCHWFTKNQLPNSLPLLKDPHLSLSAKRLSCLGIVLFIRVLAAVFFAWKQALVFGSSASCKTLQCLNTWCSKKLILIGLFYYKLILLTGPQGQQCYTLMGFSILYKNSLLLLLLLLIYYRAPLGLGSRSFIAAGDTRPASTMPGDDYSKQSGENC